MYVFAVGLTYAVQINALKYLLFAFDVLMSFFTEHLMT